MIQQFFGQYRECAALCCSAVCGANVVVPPIIPRPPDGEYHKVSIFYTYTNIQPKKTNLAPESFLNSPNFSYDIKETPPQRRCIL